METIEANKITSETLGGVSLSAQPSDGSHNILKPCSESQVLSDERKDVGGGGGTVVVTKVVERTEVTVVTVLEEKVKETEKGDFGNLVDGEKGFEHMVVEKNEGNEVKKTENEGNFGNLVDGDEGMKVNLSENGGSVVMDVKNDSLADENGSGMKSFFEGDDKNAGGDPMEVCLSESKETNVEKLVESKEETNKNTEENTENGQDNNINRLADNEEEEYEGEDEIEEDHDFVIGDFVWGKIKSHPWWPGQIYDPSDASDYADTLKRKNRLLVAYFGDGSFSWCSPSQLKPFIDPFQEMSSQSDSKKFVNAVQKALEEVNRLVEAEFTCKCQHPVDQLLTCPVNSGVKEGVLVPKGNTVKVLIERILEPVCLLSILKAYATMEEDGRRMVELELGVVKSYLSAFYSKKGGYLLQEYCEPKCIEGLEDEEERNVNGPSESAENGGDRRRKQKSVAELLGDGGEDELKSKKAKTSSSGAKSSTGRKRKSLVVSVSPESDHESGGGGGGDDDMASPRQRKKSKYLSPPYLSPIWTTGKLSGSFKEAKSEPEKERVPEMAAKQLEESFKRRKPRQKRHESEGEGVEGNMVIMDAADVDVNKVLNGLLVAALDPPCFVEKKKKELPVIAEFISSYRSFIFEEGFDRKKSSTGMSLVIDFPPEVVSLPTKTELSKTYKKFGELVKKEIHTDEARVVVVFGNGSDAEAALEMSLEKKPFGDVKYALSEEGVKKGGSSSSRKKGVAEEKTEVELIKQKLEAMRETVEKCGEEEMKGEVKASLEQGIKEVLEKVGQMRDK